MLLYYIFGYLVYFGLVAADGVFYGVGVDGVCSIYLVYSSGSTLGGGYV